jgi:hypothetical protein
MLASGQALEGKCVKCQGFAWVGEENVVGVRLVVVVHNERFFIQVCAESSCLTARSPWCYRPVVLT